MTYSHNSIGNNNLKMTTTTASATTKAVRNNNSNNKHGGGNSGSAIKQQQPQQQQQQQQYHRRTPTTPIAITSSPTTTTTFNCIDNNTTLHSNSIACSTNQQYHPLMSGGSSPPNACALSVGSYFGQRKQKLSVRQAPATSTIMHNSTNSIGGNNGSGFFHKNNQYYQNNIKRNINNNNNNNNNKQQQQYRTPQQSPATILSNSFSEYGGSHHNKNALTGATPLAASTGRKRRPKIHLQSPIITAPSDLGVGGNISPTHPLLPTVLTHFAGSKCFDAPAPSAVPKPPQHWTQITKLQQKTPAAVGPNVKSCATKMREMQQFGFGHVVKSSKRNLLDDFDTHNLKLILNVQS